MSVSRRSFLRSVGAGSAALAFPWVTARGHEATVAELSRGRRISTLRISDIRLDSNENPYGPAAEALEAVKGMFTEACRYPDLHNEKLIEAIAAHVKVPKDHLLQGSGSGEILRLAVDAFASPTRGLVTASPTFELPADRAKALGFPVKAVPVTSALKLDLEGMAAKAGAAGLVFLCNPNNPTATVHGEQALRGAIDQILRSSEAVILVDEAYHEYVQDPSYRSFIPLALQEPRVVVSRTFSKVYGMAGLRVGYAVARPETIKRLAANILPNNVNVLAAAAAWTSLSVPGHADRQVAKNTETREFTRKSLESAGYTVIPSQTNFLMVDIRRDVKAFREACRAKGILVGRPFPPLDTHARISIGTMDEMRKATAVFADVLRT